MSRNSSIGASTKLLGEYVDLDGQRIGVLLRGKTDGILVHGPLAEKEWTHCGAD
jgi:hypothetical protein